MFQGFAKRFKNLTNLVYLNSQSKNIAYLTNVLNIEGAHYQSALNSTPLILIEVFVEILQYLLTLDMRQVVL